MKKTLSVILAAAIVLTLFVFVPATAEAKKSGEYVYTVTDGKAEITAYTGSESEIFIPSDFDGVPITSVGNNAFKSCHTLRSVVIPDSVTLIRDYAFYDSGLTSVIIGNSVVNIRPYAFLYCKDLSNITIPDSVEYIGYGAFHSTAWYTNQPNGIVYAGKVAYSIKGNCSPEIILKDGTKGIAENAFSNCGTLKSITIPDSVLRINNEAFSNCKALERIIIGHSLISIGFNAFKDCVSLQNITIPETVNYIGSTAFYNCVSLESAIILNYDTTIVFDAFSSCNELTIYGYKGSTAEELARSRNISFVPLDGEATTEPTTQAITEPTMQVPTVAPTTPTAKPILGDIDGDGKVTITDATLLQKYAAEIDTPYPIGEPIE